MNSSLRNGHTTGSLRLIKSLVPPVKRKIVYAEIDSNHWSSTEYNSNNSWNVNFNDGNINNNNKNNQYVVRPVVALREDEMAGWVEAFIDCCRRKKSTIQCSLYRTNYERDLIKLAREVKARTYIPSVSTCFVVSRPKYREIFAANFRDRVAQHWIVRRIEPLLEERFQEQGDVSFNCRKGFGTLAAVRRLKKNIEEVSFNYTEKAWIGKFDMKSFFMSIDKTILLSLVTDFVKKNYHEPDLPDLLWLLEVTIMHCPQKLCIKKGRLYLWDELPPEKSLFNTPDTVGMPIGNITSQLLANFYLSFLDEYMNYLCALSGNTKYIRFVDDFVIVSRSKKAIKIFWEEANKFLRDHLRITLHPDKKYIQEVKKGVKFVGSVIKPGRIYLSNRTVGGLFCMLNTLDIVF